MRSSLLAVTVVLGLFAFAPVRADDDDKPKGKTEVQVEVEGGKVRVRIRRDGKVFERQLSLEEFERRLSPEGLDAERDALTKKLEAEAAAKIAALEERLRALSKRLEKLTGRGGEQDRADVFADIEKLLEKIPDQLEKAVEGLKDAPDKARELEKRVADSLRELSEKMGDGARPGTVRARVGDRVVEYPERKGKARLY